MESDDDVVVRRGPAIPYPVSPTQDKDSGEEGAASAAGALEKEPDEGEEAKFVPHVVEVAVAGGYCAFCKKTFKGVVGLRSQQSHSSNKAC